MKNLKRFAMIFAFSMVMTSCYVQTSMVGKGAQGNNEVKEWNHYLIGGLAPVSVSKPEKMANGSQNYTTTTKHSFVNGLVNVITFGLYTPTTTIVKY